jgi:hypothetical protein
MHCWRMSKASRMVLWLGLLALAGVLMASAQQDPCNCKPNVGKKRPYRLDAKWETKYDSYPVCPDTIVSSTVRAWEPRYQKQMKRDVIWSTKRIKKTPEDTLYVLKGWMWYVKQEVDCDFHIEIGPKAKSGKRTVVEVTKNSCKLEEAILKRMEQEGYKLAKEFKKGIPCVVVGLGFYDGQHPLKSHSRAAERGSSWELHPVQSIEFQ